MKFVDLRGNVKSLQKASSYVIDWEGKSRSKFQKHVKDFLRSHWEGHVLFEEMPIVGTRLSLDFYNANLKVAIEVQGAQHLRHVKFFHKNRQDFVRQLDRDAKKLKFCQLNDITLIEIYSIEECNKEFFAEKGIFL